MGFENVRYSHPHTNYAGAFGPPAVSSKLDDSAPKHFRGWRERPFITGFVSPKAPKSPCADAFCCSCLGNTLTASLWGGTSNFIETSWHRFVNVARACDLLLPCATNLRQILCRAGTRRKILCG